MKKLFNKKVITCLVILCAVGIFFYVRNKNNLNELYTNNTDLLYHD